MGVALAGRTYQGCAVVDDEDRTYPENAVIVAGTSHPYEGTGVGTCLEHEVIVGGTCHSRIVVSCDPCVAVAFHRADFQPFAEEGFGTAGRSTVDCSTLHSP